MSNKYGKKLLKIELELVAQTNAMLAFWDKDLICRYANNAYREWFGKSPEEMIDKMRLDDLLGPLYEKNRPYIERVLKGETQVFERDIPTPSGVTRSSITTYRPYFKKGKVEGFFVHVADITPVKKNLIASSNGSGNENVLLPDEMEKVVKTLQANIFCAFPGINQLAKLHHISPSKLKRDFGNRFHKGIFCYFRQMQMEFAYNYFKRNRCSKKEMAAMLNFSNPSNFSVCYNNYLKERKVEERIEDILKANDERYKTFIAQSPFSIAMLDKDCRFLAASQKWFDFFQSSEIEQTGRHLHEVFPSDDYWNDIYQRALCGEMLSKDEHWLVFADKKICIKWDVRPWYMKPDSIGGLLFYLEDITEAKLRETESMTLQEILEKTNEIARIGAWKRNFVTEEGYWNKIAREIIEVPDDTLPTLGFALNVYREGESRDKALKALNEALTNGSPIDFEAEIVTAKGNVKRVRVIGYPVFSGDRCEKLLGVFQEVKSHG